MEHADDDQSRTRSRDESLAPVTGKEAEGSDSGVEVSGGGGGSTVGGPGGDLTPAASCDSSLLSCCCSSEDLLSHTLQLPDELSLSTGDHTSEGGSESSSVTGYHQSGVRKKCPLTRTPSTSRPSPSPISSRSRTPLNKTAKTTPSSKSLHPSRSAITPSSTPRSHRDLSESSASRKTISRVPSVSKNNNSPTDDGRWPSTLNKSAQKNRPIDKKTPTNSIMTNSLDSKSTSLEKYATLPRRRRKSADNLTLSEPLSSREPSLNRSASLRKKQNPMVSSATAATLQPNTKTMPPYPRKARAKTRIYHEISIQTALTGADLESGFSGSLLRDVHSRVETRSCGIQVDRELRRVLQLEVMLKECKSQLSQIAEEKEELNKACEQMKVDQAVRNADTIRLKTLIVGKHNSDDVVGQLERQVISTNDLVNKQQQEITQLHDICHTLQRELEKSHLAQKKLLKHQEEIETESSELQEFLQAEKAAMADTLRDTETELSETREIISAKEAEIQRQQEECSHLVRVSEQRRQEQLSLEARLAGMELRNRESLLQQGAAVSGASVALSRLGIRLDHLVDTLVNTYCISEADLEDVIFHNEAYSQSQSSGSSSSSADSSPRPRQPVSTTVGFMTAVLNAIRTATAHQPITTEPSSEAEPMLSSEPEPTAFAHRDVTTSSSPLDTEKRLSIASIASCEASPSKHSDYEVEGRLANSESLHNLSVAILRRQQLEAEDAASLASLPPVAANTLVDQVIEVDNLVTKLLKVIGIIQQANDNSALQERKKLCTSLSEAESQLAGKQEIVSQLTQELQQLRQNNLSLQDTGIEKENQLGKATLSKQLITDNWSQAMAAVHRQYQAIDSALEVLASVQGVVQQSPALVQMQKDLEETNFQCAANVPLVPSPDLNANGLPGVINGTA